MSNWLQKFISKPPARRTQLPAIIRQGVPALQRQLRNAELAKGLPNATIIYGAASGAFFVFAISLIVRSHWIDGLLTMLPAICFLGFALHLLKHGQPKR